jgi:glycosyltransferase involved in cell wall biosynthesis
MSSRFEGFPNALIEAMACGLPAVSFDCPSGPAEIIHNGTDGILVPPGNVELLTLALDNLMGDEEMRNRMATNATRIRDRLNRQTIVQSWAQLLEEM